MKRTTTWLTTILIISALHGAAATFAAADAVDPATWVPNNALAYFGVTDIGRTWEDIQQTAGYKMLSDPAAAEAIPEMQVFEPIIKKVKEKVADAVGVPVGQLKNPLSGPLALYVSVPSGGKVEDIEPGLVAGVGDMETMKKYYDTLVTKLKDVAKHETKSAGEVTIDVFTADPDAKPEEEGDEEEGFSPPAMGESPQAMIEEVLDKLFSPESMPATLALCLTEDRLIVTGTEEQARRILKGEPSGKTLADTDDYKALRRHLKPVGTVHFLVNLPGIIELAKAETDASELEEMREWLGLLGAQGLRSAVGHMRFGASSYDSKVELLFLMSGPRQGLAKILSMENRPVTPPPSVSKDCCLYVNLNLNAGKLVDEILTMARQTDADTATQIEQEWLGPWQTPTGETIHRRKDIIDHLTGPLSGSLAFQLPLAPGSGRVLVTMGQDDQSALLRAITASGQMQPRDFQGTQIFDMPPLFSAAVMPRQIVLGNAPTVEAVVASSSGAEALAESEQWRRAARFVPDQAWCTFYVDGRRMLEAALALAEAGGQAQAMAMMDPGLMILGQFYGQMIQKLDPQELPKARKLLDYSASTIFTIATTDEGVRFTSVGMKPGE